jgi:pimeloyl-ACP methyl ester carboxylesterase
MGFLGGKHENVLSEQTAKICSPQYHSARGCVPLPTESNVRISHLSAAVVLSCTLLSFQSPVRAVGRPGITPIACPQQTWTPDDPSFEALPGARAFFGPYDGGIYRIEIPNNWNGELMLSAHGFVANGGATGSRLRVGLPAIRQHLIEQGFAWAASSYRCNGYVPGMGLLDTMALTEMFTRFNGGTAPRRVYLTGTSMGGHVTLLGMHEFPTSFAGGLAMCPAGPELFDYFTAVGAAAEAITSIKFSDPATVSQDVRKMAPLLGEPPNYTDKGRQLASVEIELSGGPRPFAAEGLRSRFIQNISGGALAGSQTPSNRAATNANFTYRLDESLGLSSDKLNALVRRKNADMSMRSATGPYDELVPLDGQLERPVLTMHGTGDLFVPIHLEQILRRAVTAAGRDDRLVQRVYRIPGHCNFSVPEQARAFDDLVRWVREGVRPEGDSVFGDLRDAGRRFTDPLRDGDPGGLTVH